MGSGTRGGRRRSSKTVRDLPGAGRLTRNVFHTPTFHPDVDLPQQETSRTFCREIKTGHIIRTSSGKWIQTAPGGRPSYDIHWRP